MLDLSGRWAGLIPDYYEWQLTYDFPYLSLGEKASTSRPRSIEPST